MVCQQLDHESACLGGSRSPWLSPTMADDIHLGSRSPCQWDVPLPGKFGGSHAPPGTNISAPPGLEMGNGSPCLEYVPSVVRPKKREGKTQRRLKGLSNGEADAGKAAQPMTTVMVRNIACRYTKEQVMEFIDNLGLKGTYDFLYLPLNPVRRANLGYIFINFTSFQAVEECKRLLNGKPLGPSTTEKRCEVALARVQGQANITAHFRRKSVMRSAHAPVFVSDDTDRLQQEEFKQYQQEAGMEVFDRLSL